MEYTVDKLAKLAGVSSRALRYYDELGILKPARINSSGYRIYGAKEVDRLQQILFYRELGVPLDTIKSIVTHPEFDGVAALKAHREELLDRRSRLDALIANVDKTIAVNEGRIAEMSDNEKFEGFKQKLIDDNEKQYGREVREKYGDEAVDRANAKVKGMTEAQHAEAARLSEELAATLADAFRTGDPAGEPAQRAAELHKRWLMFYWSEYSPEAHAGLAQTYVDDERFTAYYDKEQPGTAAFLRDAIRIYAGQRQ